MKDFLITPVLVDPTSPLDTVGFTGFSFVQSPSNQFRRKRPVFFFSSLLVKSSKNENTPDIHPKEDTGIKFQSNLTIFQKFNPKSFHTDIHTDRYSQIHAQLKTNSRKIQAEVQYLIGRNFVGGKFRRQKIFVGKNFRHLLKISSLFADEYFLPTFFYQ